MVLSESKYKLIVFDFDYTMGDSTNGIYECMCYALDKMGYTVMPEISDIKPTIGKPLQDAYTMLTGDSNIDKANTFFKYFKEYAKNVIINSATLYEGVKELVLKLHNKGYLLGIVTTKAQYQIEGIMKKLGIYKAFSVMVGGDFVANYKPDPEGLNMIISRLNVDKRDVLYVGDTTIDAMTASNSGVDFLGVLTGTTTREELMQYANISIIERLAD